MKILFIGGYGNISWWCAKRALEEGHEVFLLNRNLMSGTRREIPKEAKIIIADYKNFEQTKNALKNYSFDVVCDFLCREKTDAERAFSLFKDKTKQYIFISSEAVYKRNKNIEIYDENSIQYDENEVSSYISGKIASEKFFIEKFKKEKFPLTIVRPGYTLDTILPYSIGQNCCTIAKKYLDGYPFLIAGNGKNIWTFTHSSDFANAFISLFGNTKTIGEAYNIMGDNHSTFNEIMTIFAQSLSEKPVNLLHIPYENCLSLKEFMPKDLMEQRMMNAIFDTTKIKKITPSWNTKFDIKTMVMSTIDWLKEDKRHIRINEKLDKNLEDLTRKYEVKIND